MSSINSKDAVLEIGPGKGIITQEITKKAKHVIAVEIDNILCQYLEKKFQKTKKIQIIHKDILFFSLPFYPYKVFANIPFNIEGKIIRKLLSSLKPPEDCYLVMRRDLAERLSGVFKEGKFSICYKRWFSFEIMYSFKKSDFTPFAKMDTMLLRFTTRHEPLLSINEKKQYMAFVDQGFRRGPVIKKSLEVFFSHEQMKRLAKKYSFNPRDKPSTLTLNQWIGLYKYAKELKRS